MRKSAVRVESLACLFVARTRTAQVRISVQHAHLKYPILLYTIAVFIKTVRFKACFLVCQPDFIVLALSLSHSEDFILEAVV